MDGQRTASVAKWLLLFCASASQVLGNGLIRDGVGAISIGRGGTNIAFSDNTAVLLDNPAGMVGMTGQSMFQLSVDGLLTDIHYQDPFSGDRAAFRPMALPEIGFIRRSDDEIWAWGFAVAVPAGFGTQYELSDPVFGNQNYSSFGALAKFLPALACQVTENLAVGATLGVGVSYVGLDGPFYVQTGPLQGAPTVLDVQGAGATLIWSFGIQYYLTDFTKLGIAYQSQSRCELKGNAHVEALGQESFFDSQLNLTWPSTLGIGVLHDLDDRQRLSADLIWVHWSSAFDSLGVQLSNGSNALLPPAITDEFPFRWNDSLSLRLGYEYFVTPCSVLRAGYVYNTNQIPDGTLTPYLPAILEHAFSIGCGRTWDDWSLDAAYQYSFGPDRRVVTSDLVGGDFSNSEVQAQAHWVSIALTRQY